MALPLPTQTHTWIREGKQGTWRKSKRRTTKKEVWLGEKKEIVNSYVFQGLKLSVWLKIAKITKHQYYYIPKKTNQGLKPSTTTIFAGLDGHEMTILI